MRATRQALEWKAQGEHPLQLLEHVDDIRRQVAAGTARKHKSAMGQFMTGASVARFMAQADADSLTGVQ